VTATHSRPPILETVSVRPAPIDYWLILTALRPLSHHDPAQGGSGNTLLFNRERKLLPLPWSETRPDAVTLQALYDNHPCPPTFAPVLADLSPPSFLAAALLKLFCDLYNSAEGMGVFAGMERYERLSQRVLVAATRTGGLRSFWDALLTTLACPVSASHSDPDLFAFFALPKGLQLLVLRALVKEHASLTAISRSWHSENKQYSPEYVAKSGGELLTERCYLIADADAVPDEICGVAPVDVYEVSNNSLRHQVVRAPAWLHLASFLGVAESYPGQGRLPAGAEALFVNGGNMAGKAPNDPHKLAMIARQNFPVLDLLGGCCDGFDLGESRLSVAGWLVCKENRAALSDTPASELPGLGLSAFEMSDEVTATRQSTERGVGQMIMSFEALAAGAQIAVRLSLKHWTRGLTEGALVAAIHAYVSNHPHVGGQVARGYGLIGAARAGQRWESGEENAVEYEVDLIDNRDALRGWLEDGTLGTGKKILS
jgi:hypothetical protein